MQIISSKDNEQIKAIRKLKEKKYRDETGCYIIEGMKMVKEAIYENVAIKLIVICEDCEDVGLNISGNVAIEKMQVNINEKANTSEVQYKKSKIEQSLLYEIAKYECIYVTKKIFDSLSDVQTPQGILAVVEKNKAKKVNDDNVSIMKLDGNTNISNDNASANAEISYSEDVIFALDGIQDPGNLGTILRTLDSANLKQVIISENTADPYNPKVVRSTMGAIFRVNIIRVQNLAESLKNARKHKYEIVATSLDTNTSIYDINYKKKVIVIGNEANGVSKEIQDLADKKVKIPMLRKNRKLKCISSYRYYDL